MSRFSTLFSTFMMAVMPWTASAQDASAPPPEPTTSITVSGIIAWIPAGNVDRTGSSYLEKGLGGVAPGIAITLGAAHSRGATVDLEVSKTGAISERQTYIGAAHIGRSRRELDARHTHTLVSLLAGYRQRRNPRQWLEYKAGGTLIFGQTSRTGDPVDPDVAGKFAVTGGIDWVSRTKGNLVIVFGAKHSYAFRGGDNYNLYLGAHIVRVGVGIRWGLK